jgi:hypothetical protein
MLDWKNVDIPFTGGLSDDAHKFVGDPPLVREAENISFDKTGAATKRGSLTLLDGLSSQESLLFKTGRGLQVFNKNGVYGFKESTGTLGSVSGRPVPYSSKVTAEAVHAGLLGSDQWDMLAVDGAEIFVWSEPDPYGPGSVIFPMKSLYLVRVDGVVTQGPAELTASGANLTGHMMRVTYAGPQAGSISGIRWDDRRFFVIPFTVASGTVTFGSVVYPFTTEKFINFDACSGYDGTNNRVYYVLQGVAIGTTFGDTRALRHTHSGLSLSATTVVLATDPSSVDFLLDVGLGVYFNRTESRVYFCGCSLRHDNVRLYTTDASLGSKSAFSNVYTFNAVNGDYFGNWGQTSSVAVSNVVGLDSSMQVFRCTMTERAAGGVHLLWQGMWSATGGTPQILGGSRADIWCGVRYIQVQSNRTPSGSAVVANNVSLIGKCFRQDSEVFVPLSVDMASASVMHDSPDVDAWTYYMGLLCRVDQTNGFIPIARFAADTLAPGQRWEDYDDVPLSNQDYSTKFAQPVRTVSEVSPGVWTFACEFVNSQGGRVLGIAAELAAFRLTGAAVKVDLTKRVTQSAQQIGGGAVLGSGTLLHFDGSNIYEVTPPTAPRVDITTFNDGLGGSHTWDFYACWAFTDRTGVRWRSPITTKLNRGIENDTSATLVVAKPPPWQVASLRAAVLEVYAQVQGVDDRPYLIRVLDASASLTVAEPFLTISISGAVAVNGAENLSRFAGGSIIPYTLGGELSNDPMGPVLGVEVWDNRIWGIDGDSPSRVFFSKSFDPVQPWGFNRNLFVTVPQGEQAVALARMDESLVVLTNTGVYIVQGRGPENTGVGPTYSMTRLESDGGCANPNSVAICPLGVLFASEKGILLLTRGYEVKFIGGPVEDSLDVEAISAATTVASRGECVFFEAGKGFVWNYEVNAWSKWTTDLPSSVYSAVEFKGDLYVAGGNQLRRLSTNPNNLTCVLETSWIKLSGLQGYKAIREILVLGELVALDTPALGQIRVQVDYDYSPSSSELFVFDVANIASSSEPLSLRIQPSRRKCKSFKIRIFDTLSPTNQTLEADNKLTLSGLTVEVGIKMLGDKTPRTPQAS